jgi:Xaa-Pro aminopeptidase
MRRGLMAWDAEEIPADALRVRIRRLQAAMAANGQDAIILYTNFIRSSAVSYLTAFSPYWADGILLVPMEGEPVFATTLSKRVGSWIQTVKPVGDLVNSPTPGMVLGKELAEGKIKRLAILELDAFPSGLYDDLKSMLPGVEIVDGSDSFAIARSSSDPVERRLLEHADRMAQDALAQVNGRESTVGEAIAAVEKHARLQGAEEAYVAIAPDMDVDHRFLRLSGERPLGSRFAIRATIAYKGSWSRRTRTFSRDAKDAAAIRDADAWFASVLAGIDAKRALGGQIAARISKWPGAHLVHWLAESPIGTHPLAAVASPGGEIQSSTPVPALVLTVGLTVGGMAWCGAGLAKQ